MANKKRILTINPGSTSTKLALFEDETELLKQELAIRAEDIAHCTLMIQQLDIRMQSIRNFIQEAKLDLSTLDMIVARGGSIHGVRSGAYLIDAHVDAMLRYRPRSQHVSSLAAIIAYQLSLESGVPAIFYDAPSADDADEIMHYTGLPECRRFVTSHCLNSKMVARQVAERLGKPYEACNIIVAHLGGGITMAFHSGGRMVDTLLDDAGPMSPQRAGRIPVTDVINLCYSGRYTREEMANKMRGRGGLVAWFGVNDARDVEAMIDAGDQKAKEVYWYMAYQIAKGIGELSVVQSGKLDRIVLTGGLAWSKRLTDWVTERVEFLAPVIVIPGEQEMLALAQGGMRVLRGEEEARRYTWLPPGYDSLEAFLKDCGSGERG
ncbi:butyrate kinase [Flavonifractor sp. An306]|uniref:butyrate kinase n=1 Tax=Flavonifractor sp. An306 TaxID=1965629 RepID=UPI001748C9EF|nr:butyrate kinase [Flavonifractor sp. An306]